MIRFLARRRVILVVASVVAAAAVIAAAVALADSQRNSRHTLEDRFAGGSGTAAALVETIIAQAYASDRELGEQRLAGRDLTSEDVRRAAARTGSESMVVLDAGGDRVASWPQGADVADGPAEHREQALGGQPAISGPLTGRSGKVIEVAVPYQAETGRRVVVIASSLRQVQAVLGPYLKRIPGVRGRRALILDHAHGDAKLADSAPGSPIDPGLMAALSGAPAKHNGSYDGGDRYVSSVGIAGTPWALVRTTTTSILYEPVEGWQKYLPWILLALLLAAGAVMVLLADRAGRAAERARRASEAKSAFLASMSHELRTPMTTVMGFSEMLARGRLGELSDRQRETVGHIHASSRHLNQLISEALDLSRVEEGRIHFAPEDVRPHLLVAEVADSMGGLADDRGIDIAVDAPDIGVWRVDPGRFKQVLYNLIGNAIKFTEGGGSVGVRLWRDESTDELGLEVTDTGTGIAPEDLGRIFEPFEQGGSGRNGGAGLGLAISHRIVDAQGGRIAVRSSVGEGSTFEVTLPLQQA